MWVLETKLWSLKEQQVLLKLSQLSLQPCTILKLLLKTRHLTNTRIESWQPCSHSSLCSVVVCVFYSVATPLNSVCKAGPLICTAIKCLVDGLHSQLKTGRFLRAWGQQGSMFSGCYLHVLECSLLLSRQAHVALPSCLPLVVQILQGSLRGEFGAFPRMYLALEVPMGPCTWVAY